MANQLDMNKSFAIQNLRSAGYSERRIAQSLGVSRGAVRRHLADRDPNSTKVRTGSEELPAAAPEDSNGTKVRTGRMLSRNLAPRAAPAADVSRCGR